MKIVTWNANMKFRKKEGLLVKQLDPDIAFIQECESPDKYPDEFPYKLFPLKESNSLEGDFQNVNEILNKNDIESVYHHWFKEDFGREKNPTYFMFKKESKSYHTDYIFLKKNTIDNIKNFSVGKYNEWIGYSDHMPLLIEI